MTPTKVLVGQVLIVFAIVIATLWFATEWAAAELGHQHQLGTPWFSVLSDPLYYPGLGGPPRSVAILNGMMAAALGIGLQLWIAGLALWVVGHAVAVFASKREPQVAAALARHLRQKAYLAC